MSAPTAQSVAGRSGHEEVGKHGSRTLQSLKTSAAWSHFKATSASNQETFKQYVRARRHSGLRTRVRERWRSTAVLPDETLLSSLVTPEKPAGRGRSRTKRHRKETVAVGEAFVSCMQDIVEQNAPTTSKGMVYELQRLSTEALHLFVHPFDPDGLTTRVV